MKVAILACGSLVWDRRNLALAGSFEPVVPSLAIESCRDSGGGRLTPVIDEAFGAPCVTYAAVSIFDDRDGALQDRWTREGSGGERLPRTNWENGRVGFIDLISSRASTKAIERHPRAVETISAWVAANGFDAAIWTALASNFHGPDRAGEPFSVEAAIRYLEARDAHTLDNALTYIRRAPDEVRTPGRAAVNARLPEG